MEQVWEDVHKVYELCNMPSDIEYPVVVELNKGELNNILYSDKNAFTRNSAFSYAACGASSVGADWLNENGFRL